MASLKCAAPGCAARAHINPSYCGTHIAAHYAAGGLDTAWWAQQTEQDRTAWREATGPDGRIDLVLASLRSSVASIESSGAPIDSDWFAAMTIAALDTIEIAPAGATVTLSAALFAALWGRSVFNRHPRTLIARANDLPIVVDPEAMDSRLAYDDFTGERIVVVLPSINGLR